MMIPTEIAEIADLICPWWRELLEEDIGAANDVVNAARRIHITGYRKVANPVPAELTDHEREPDEALDSIGWFG